MTKILLGLAAGMLLALLMAGGQDDPTPQLTQVQRAIADLGLRVSRLEHADGVTAGPVDSGSPSPAQSSAARSMVVAGIQTADSPPPNHDQIDGLQDDIDALQKTVNVHKDNADRVAGNAYYVGGHYSGGHYGYDHSVAGRNNMEMSQQQMAGRYATQLGIKKKQLDDLEHAAKVPHQIIHGHDGEVIFTLRTRVNLAADLKNINIGDTVTWRGERSTADGSSEVWLITSITKIARP